MVAHKAAETTAAARSAVRPEPSENDQEDGESDERVG